MSQGKETSIKLFFTQRIKKTKQNLLKKPNSLQLVNNGIKSHLLN